MADEEDKHHRRGAPTPRVTASWSLFKELSLAFAVRLDAAAKAKRTGKVTIRVPDGRGGFVEHVKDVPILIDPEGAGQFTERARWLKWMSKQFAAWPEQPEKAANERQLLGSLLLEVQRETEEALSHMHGGPW